VPAYYPPGAHLEGVRVRVRVSSKRQRFDRAEAEARERDRRAGLAEGDGRAAHAELNPGAALGERELTARVRSWSERDGLLVEAGAGEAAPYLFLHLTIQEYLTARYLAARLNDRGWAKAAAVIDGKEVPVRELIDRKAWLPAWQEVVALLAGSLDDPVPLLELLADEAKDDLFRHRLALAARCLPEIEALLPRT
jgi:hypothetical protein